MLTAHKVMVEGCMAGEGVQLVCDRKAREQREEEGEAREEDSMKTGSQVA